MTPGDADNTRYARLEALPTSSDAQQAYLDALTDSAWSVRQLAAERLAGLGLDLSACQAVVALLSLRDNPGARNAAAWVLARAGRPGLEATLPLLGSTDPDVRKFAADILGDSRAPEAVEPLVATTHDSDENVRLAALEALGRLGTTRALEVLSRQVDVGGPLMQIGAVEGLLLNGVRLPLPTLIRLLKQPETARTALRALVHHMEGPAISAVMNALVTPSTRDAALQALGAAPRLTREWHQGLKQVAPLLHQRAAELSRALGSDDEAKVRGALQIVEALGDAVFTPAVISLLSHASLAQPALRTLLHLGPAAATALLSRLLSGDFDEAALPLLGEALVDLVDARHVDALSRLVQQGHAELSLIGIKALGATGSPEAIAPLCAALEGPAARRAAQALIALSQVWPQRVRDAVLSPGATMPSTALLTVMAHVAAEHAVPVIEQFSQSAEASHRVAAAELASTPGVPTLRLLQAAVLDEQSPVREAACVALARLPANEASALLERALGDENPRVIGAALSSVASLRLATLASTIQRLLERPEPMLVLAALNALERLGVLDIDLPEALFSHREVEVITQALRFCSAGTRARVRLRKALHDSRWQVRAAAARWLAVAGTLDDVGALELALSEESNDVAQQVLKRSLASLKPGHATAP